MNPSPQFVPQIDQMEHKNLETATLAMGCFWGPDALFGVQSGIVRTRVGYAGGNTSNPTYHQIGDHIETIQVDYNPDIISYQQLLQLFWQNHNSNRAPHKRQYTSALFFHNETQKRLLQESKKNYSNEVSMEVRTEIIAFDQFYLAENYHQKYHLQQIPELISHFQAIYPNFRNFIDSTAAARINGYVAGYGKYKQLQNEIDAFSLPENTRLILKNLIC